MVIEVLKLRRLTDEALAAEAARLERRLDRLEAKGAALRLATSAVAARLYQDAADALDQARAEADRRRC